MSRSAGKGVGVAVGVAVGACGVTGSSVAAIAPFTSSISAIDLRVGKPLMSVGVGSSVGAGIGEPLNNG